MKISILRGQNQIGGSIVEISAGKTRIFFDVGVNLDESVNTEIPGIDGLFCGKKNCDGGFISHYHSDHIGLIPHLLPDIPVYMGEQSYRIFSAAANYREKHVSFVPKFLNDREKIRIGNITITPFGCDHSAYDAYMFLIEADGKSALYTGDFRANGRLDFQELLKAVPTVDAVITEGTMLSRDTEQKNLNEETLEGIAENCINKHKGPVFIMISSMNVDRLLTAYNAAVKTNRLFLEDIYTADILSAIPRIIPAPGKGNGIRVFSTGGDKQYELLQKYGNAKIGKFEIAKSPFIMCVRQSMKNYLSKLNEILSFEDGVLFYAMWKGYMEQPDTESFIRFLDGKGVKLHFLHTGGHADTATIDKLLKAVKPGIIIPIHTENAQWFDRYSDTCKVVYNEQNIEL